MTVARCMKCRTNKEMKNVIMTKTSRGVPMAKGICTTCGTKMCRIGGMK